MVSPTNNIFSTLFFTGSDIHDLETYQFRVTTPTLAHFVLTLHRLQFRGS